MIHACLCIWVVAQVDGLKSSPLPLLLSAALAMTLRSWAGLLCVPISVISFVSVFYPPGIARNAEREAKKESELAAKLSKLPRYVSGGPLWPSGSASAYNWSQAAGQLHHAAPRLFGLRETL
ncbi:unnamed protein product [Polarella glacialis]|uniref:Uncharacterized protein n=1 Tax=Polarella glacialis TaxID=89957 RepID=A0A813LI33_POLGL|nr:unnamed protein product [Polarella glacialis]